MQCVCVCVCVCVCMCVCVCLVSRGEEDLDLVHLDAQVVRVDAHLDVHLLQWASSRSLSDS